MKIDYKLEQIALEKLGVPPENLRLHNTDLELDDLEINIHAVGQSQPILVYPLSNSSGHYEILEGQRRLNAFDRLNQKYPNIGYDKILAMVRSEPENSNRKKAISLGANITQLPMTLDDIQKGVIDLWMINSNMKLVAEEYGISEKTAKKYVKGARLSQRLQNATTSGEITTDPEDALDYIMSAVDLLNWTKINDVSEDKVIKTAKAFASKTRSEVGDIMAEMKKDPDQDIDIIVEKIRDQPTKQKTRKIILPPETDGDLVKYAKLKSQKPEAAAAGILIEELKKLVSQTNDE